MQGEIKCKWSNSQCFECEVVMNLYNDNEINVKCLKNRNLGSKFKSFDLKIIENDKWIL